MRRVATVPLVFLCTIFLFTANCRNTPCLALDPTCGAGLLLYILPPAAVVAPNFVSTTAPDTAAIALTDALSFTFDQTLNEDSCAADGSLGEASFDYSGATVTLSPASGSWDRGDGLGLNLSGCVGEELGTADTLSYTYFAADVVLYVNVDGSDSNAGTREAPMATAGAAITAAATTCSSGGTACAVNIGAGTYNVTASVTPGNRVSLFGGYSTDFNERDPNATHTSRLVGSGIAPNQVVALSAVTEVIVDGLYIEQPSQAGANCDAVGFFGTTSNSTIRINIIIDGVKKG